MADGDDDDLINELVRHRAAIRNYIGNAVGRGSPYVDDLTQEVFYRAFKKRSDFRPQADDNVAGLRWLHGFARFVCLEHFRERARSVDPPDTEPVDEGSVDIASVHDDRIDSERRIAQIRRLLRGPERTMLHLYYVESYTQQQIADHLGCSKAKISTDMKNALLRLQRLLGDNDDDDS